MTSSNTWKRKTETIDRRENVKGTVYLIHFDKPYHHAKHYLGWTECNLERRLEEHRTGNGSPLLHALKKAGIGWKVVRTFALRTRAYERRLHKHGKARYCPICCGDKEPATPDGF